MLGDPYNRALLVAVIIALFLAVFWLIAANRIYYNLLSSPKRMSKYDLATPGKNGHTLLPRRHAEDVYIDAGEGYLHARIFHDFESEDFVIFCHGNSGTIEDRGYMIEMSQILKLNIVIFDYRGFGESKGRINEQTILEDAKIVYDYICKYHTTPSRIIVWGESLGGASAVALASKVPCKKLLLSFAFASLRDAAIYAKIPDYKRSGMTPLLLSARKNLPNKVWIRDVKVPILLIHSIEDSLVNVTNAKILYKAISHKQKSILYIRGEHGAPQIGHEAFRVLSVFLKEYHEEPYLASDTQIEKLDTVLKYYNREINDRV